MIKDIFSFPIFMKANLNISKSYGKHTYYIHGRSTYIHAIHNIGDIIITAYMIQSVVDITLYYCTY